MNFIKYFCILFYVYVIATYLPIVRAVNRQVFLIKKSILAMGDVKQRIKDYAKEIGVDKIGFAKLEKLSEVRAISEELFENEYFANCNYLYKNLDAREDPSLLLPSGKTMIAIALNYYTEIKHNPEDTGKISRHAWGEDYHIHVKSKARLIADFLTENFSAECFVSVDGGKVFEKVWAERCGIGWQGKNSLLITKEFGSWVFLGVIITSLEIEPDAPHPNLCGKCERCIKSCPNSAIRKEKIIDIRRCIAYLTIEDRKNLYFNDNTQLSDFIYGCDVCQNVCPYNRRGKTTHITGFKPINNEIKVDISEIDELSKEEFENRFAASSIKRIGLKKIKANAAFLRDKTNK